MYNVYPVVKRAEICLDYEVYINGKRYDTDTARVSAMPFNRRWPGHQRSKSQTELISFVSLETDEKLSFDIVPKGDFDDVIIRPTSLGIKPEIRDGHVLFTLSKPAYFTVEAFGRNRALHIFADPIEVCNVDKSDENVIYYGPGEHFEEIIELHDNEILYLERGSVVYGCIRAKDAKNISILGRGILDNSLNVEKILYEANVQNNTSAITNAKRLHTVQIEYCDNVKIEGITIRDSLVYNIRPIGCIDLDIQNVKIIGCWRYNADGIDMHNCIHVRINNCFLRTFDDSVCVKGFDFYTADDTEKALREATYRNGRVYDTFKDVLVRNCVIWNDWGKCLEIGAETRAEEICDIIFEDCDIIHVCGTVLDCFNVDYAYVYDVTYRNINIEYDDKILQPAIQKYDDEEYVNANPDYVPHVVEVTVEFHEEYSKGTVKRGRNRDITFENISILGNKKTMCIFKGYDDTHMTENIKLSNFTVNGERLKPEDIEFNIGDFCKNIYFDGVRITKA